MANANERSNGGIEGIAHDSANTDTFPNPSGSGSDNGSTRGSASSANEGIDAASVAKPRGVQPGTKRGRYKRSGNDSSGDAGKPVERKSGPPRKALVLEQLTRQCVGVHAAVSLVLARMNVPWAEVVQISEDEARTLTSAVYEVALLHDVVINPKVAAYGNLIAACGIVYGTRILAVGAMKQAARQRAPLREENIAAPGDMDMIVGASLQ